MSALIYCFINKFVVASDSTRSEFALNPPPVLSLYRLGFLLTNPNRFSKLLRRIGPEIQREYGFPVPDVPQAHFNGVVFKLGVYTHWVVLHKFLIYYPANALAGE